ncbi:hypothetical protein P691DRAFT_808686 [Macrolepiota fuliginosa MF-IS2]|uniref:Uncharacterized protein n=1 Tax=Macrolepiota fuliginosa MF-IS2 TaxID=1400762 RepID=A0A9P5X6B5_9AGAR|nr:hypothetical protein P691DRAFT_808686 [Macrolepiota fuliginosa MF-IS2]
MLPSVKALVAFGFRPSRGSLPRVSPVHRPPPSQLPSAPAPLVLIRHLALPPLHPPRISPF